MSPLLAPLFAQAVTLAVQDRSELRHVRIDDRHWEAETTPGASLQLTWPRNNLAFGYGASLLALRLEHADRTHLVYHNAWINDQHRFRRTTVSANGSVSWGEINFQAAALQAPQPTTAEPEPEPQPGAEPAPSQGDGGMTPAAEGGSQDVTQTRVLNRSVSYLASNAVLSVSHQLQRGLTLNGFANYTVARGLNDESRAYYPSIRGTTLGAQGTYSVGIDAQNSFTIDVLAQQAWSSLGNRLTSVNGNGTWRHRFDGRTTSQLGGGLSNTRFSRDDGLIAYSIFPNFVANVDYTTRLWGGQLSLNLGLFSNPVMDTLRATIDPRVSAASGISYARKRFSSSLTGTAAVSVAPDVNDSAAFDAYTAALSLAYQFVDEAGVDAGARMLKQQFQGNDLIPLSYAVFVGLRLSYARKLTGGR